MRLATKAPEHLVSETSSSFSSADGSLHRPGTPADTPPHHGLDLMPESFVAVAYRRLRYTAAIALSALLFCTLGWAVAAPPPQLAGVSLLAWNNVPLPWHGNALFVALLLAVMLLIATAVSSLLVHPESPHMGLFCALLGMAGLSIRGGTVHMLVEYSQQTGVFNGVSRTLAIECVQWAFILLIAEIFCRLLHKKFFANMHWITRAAPDLAGRSPDEVDPGVARTGLRGGPGAAKPEPESPVNYAIGVLLSVLISGAVAYLLLYVLLQTQAKGQVLFGCFVAFFLSTIAAYLTVPRVPMLPLLLAVLATACAAYLYGMHMPPMYPGHSGFFATRALPIDYMTAGIPGAILGYYTAFRWTLNPPEMV